MRKIHEREHPVRMGRGRLEAEMPSVIWNVNFRGSLNTFGAFSYGNLNVTIYESDVGRFCSIAHDVLIAPPEHPTDWLSTHGFVFGDMGTLGYSPFFKKIATSTPFTPNERRTKIGNDVWIGARAFIRRGITIGDGAIIGANSTVVKDVAPFQIVAGSPARTIRSRFDDKIIEEIIKLRWWDYNLSREFLNGLNYSDTQAAIEQIQAAKEAGLPLLKPAKEIFIDGKPIEKVK